MSAPPPATRAGGAAEPPGARNCSYRLTEVRAVGYCLVATLLALARADSGDMLLITGPAGIGKNVLLGVARERALLARMGALSGRGRELAGRFSSGAARQLFERLLAGAGGRIGMRCSPGRRRALTALEGEQVLPRRWRGAIRRSRWSVACTGWW